MERPFFSVIMAIYNTERYLAEAIDSIVHQTLSFREHIQLVLVNDGSKDASGAICERYAAQYPQNVVYIDKENGGVSSARNAGIARATGQFLNFCDSDDWFDLDAFEKVKRFIEKTDMRAPVYAIGVRTPGHPEFRWINDRFFDTSRMISLDREPDFMQISASSAFFRAKEASACFFNEKVKILEDGLYIYQGIMKDTPLCGVVAGTLYNHRVREDQSSATQTINHKRNILAMSTVLFPSLIQHYLQTRDHVPVFLQNMILQEYNYYVVQNMDKAALDDEEKRAVAEGFNVIAGAIGKQTIRDWQYLDALEKKVWLLLKKHPHRLVSKGLRVYRACMNMVMTVLNKPLALLRRGWHRVKRHKLRAACAGLFAALAVANIAALACIEGFDWRWLLLEAAVFAGGAGLILLRDWRKTRREVRYYQTEVEKAQETLRELEEKHAADIAAIRASYKPPVAALPDDPALRAALAGNAAFKNKHAGKRCFIVANGPSIKQQDLSLLRDEYVFCMNFGYQIAQYADMRANYYLLYDQMLFREDTFPAEEMRKIETADNQPVIFASYFPAYAYYQKIGVASDMDIHYFAETGCFAEGEPLALDFSSGVSGYHTVAQMAVALALYMGFQEIYLLGCDCTGILNTINKMLGEDAGGIYGYTVTGSQKARFNNIVEHNAQGSIENHMFSSYKIFAGYRALQKHCEENGVTLMNATGGGLLRDIPHVSYPSLF